MAQMKPIEEIRSSCCDAQITTGDNSTIVICTQCGEVPETLKIEKQTTLGQEQSGRSIRPPRTYPTIILRLVSPIYYPWGGSGT